MRIIFTLFYFVLLCQAIFAQRKEYIGIIKTTDNQIITYKISFEVEKDGTFKGKSITDYYGFDRTESNITGTFNEKKKLMSFEEKGNITTKSDSADSLFCFVTAKDIKIKKAAGKEILAGTFTGKFPSKKTCAEGTIYLMNAYELETIVAENKELDSLKSVIENGKRLTKNQVYESTWSSNIIKVQIWDSYTEDQDKINIYVNGILTHKAIEAKEAVKNINIPFTGEEITIRIEAVNEGTAPPNTTNVNLLDQSRKHALQTNLKKGEYSEVKLTKLK